MQYLRGFAALAVVVDHTHGAVMRTFFRRSRAFRFLAYGALGVDLFFLISGFIICVIALEGAALAPATGMAAFAQRRFVRIIPLMWLMITVYAISRYASSGTIHAGAYLRATLLLPFGDVEPNQL